MLPGFIILLQSLEQKYTNYYQIYFYHEELASLYQLKVTFYKYKQALYHIRLSYLTYVVHFISICTIYFNKSESFCIKNNNKTN